MHTWTAVATSPRHAAPLALHPPARGRPGSCCWRLRWNIPKINVPSPPPVGHPGLQNRAPSCFLFGASLPSGIPEENASSLGFGDQVKNSPWMFGEARSFLGNDNGSSPPVWLPNPTQTGPWPWPAPGLRLLAQGLRALSWAGV